MNLPLDLKHAVRVLRRSPLVTAAAIASLAIGVGATTAVFSVLDGVVLRPLPYGDPDRLVRVTETVRGHGEGSAAPANYLDWQRESRTIGSFAATFSAGMALAGGGQPEQVRVQSVSGSFFTLLGAVPLHGRAFVPADDTAGRGQRLVVLGHALWQRRFGAAPGILGRTVLLGGRDATIVGVMPADFGFEPAADLWLLGQGGIPEGAPIPGDQSRIRDAHYLTVIARLRPGVHLTEAQAEMDAIAGRLARQYPDTNAATGVRLTPLRAALAGEVAPTLRLLFGAVLVMLLIASANLANLLLLRAAARSRELALRHSLGASRGAIVRQLLTESVVLALAGGSVGTLLAWWGVDGLLALAPVELPRASGVGLDARVLAVSLATSIGTGLLFGVWPAWRASDAAAAQALQVGRTVSSSRDQRRVQRLLVAGELAIAQLLLVCGGLLAASFARVQAIDPGFDPVGVITLELNLPQARYADPARREQFIGAVLEGLAALPGVERAAAASRVPMTDGINRGVWIEGRAAPANPFDSTATFYAVSDGYFRALRARLARGREFSTIDGATGQTVAIVNEAFARRYFPGEDPVGRRIGFGNRDAPEYWRTVVGVVADLRQESLQAAPDPQMFIPYTQDREGWNFAGFLVRTSGDPLRLTEAVRRAVLAADPDQPVARIRTLEGGVAATLAARRFTLVVTSLFAGIGLLLAAVGTFGVVSDAVKRRTRELGIRLALGARHGQVIGLVVGEYAGLILVAVVAGLAGGWALSRTLRAWLFDVGPGDPFTLAASAALLAGTALAACCVPARRILGVDPARTLRVE